ncbi:trypsin-like serine protease [Corynebacterium singulare]|uniref:Trypsin n=1 Tax=Corynebacterium singulare TaxID=161899 RepID=A0A0B6EXG6_9CORY|nr:trypsin-like serine protease [Corynebacterium singulare]AJI77619.1 Trypsin [Corynebacterium singulare]
MFSGFLASILSVLVAVASVFGVPHAAPGTSDGSGDSAASEVLQATSQVAVNDDRVAAVWMNGARECSAGYIGNDWWLTATHCLGRNLRLTQTDGDSAKVVASTPVAEKSDIALLKAEPMDAEAFELPDRPLRVNEKLFLVGYGGSHTFASEAVSRIEQTGVTYEIQNHEFENLLKSHSLFASRSCSGDSGAPLYQDETIFAVHTGGEENESCEDGTRRLMWHSEIYPYVDNLTALMKSYDEEEAAARLAETEAAIVRQARAQERRQAPAEKPSEERTEQPEKDRSSSLSSLSSR